MRLRKDVIDANCQEPCPRFGCPACGNNLFNVIHRRDNEDPPWYILACPECGFSYREFWSTYNRERNRVIRIDFLEETL